MPSGGRTRAPFVTIEEDWQAPITALFWGEERAIFALGDGTVRFSAPGAKTRVVTAHAGVILSAVLDATGSGVVTGGDDGRVVHTTVEGTPNEIASTGGRWVDHVALAPWGGLAWAYGKVVETANAGRTKSYALVLPSGCGGLAFAPKGQRLAVAHYGGATIASVVRKDASPDQLSWKGSHIAISWSPDARFLLTAMQEQAVHIWRLADKANLHMGGFPSKPRCLAWSAEGTELATSGSRGALIWSFKGKDGAQGQVAGEIGYHINLVSSLVWHPVSNVLAIGYLDGAISLAEPGKERTIYLRAGDGSAISSLAWRTDGAMLAFASEGGAAGFIDCTTFGKR